MTTTLIIQFIAAAFSVILGAFLCAWAIFKMLDDEDDEGGIDNSMLTDILQELYNAKQSGDDNEIERKYKLLERLGMDRMTADEVLKAGKKYFGREV